MTRYFAHSGDQSDYSDWQSLREHLIAVATSARRIARETLPIDVSLADAAYTAGLLHDLGKYRPEFQDYIVGKPGVQKERTYHKQAGAAKAASHPPIAFAIAGHHGGMPNRAELANLIKGDSGLRVASAVWEGACTDCPELVEARLQSPVISDRLYADLFTRLVFSCLVDADWSDTADHDRCVKGRSSEPPPIPLQAESWLGSVLHAIAERAHSCTIPIVAQVRAEVLRDCLAAAAQRPGLFKLTVPTGGGKTLSSLAFALKHAAVNELRRVIYVAPYLTILDQNARVIRDALRLDRDAAELFEHHSLSDPPGDGDQETDREAAARRAENWDAPLIITTNVQFFESLFSNKPGRCRKVHNIAGSVIILDECQTLPPDVVAPTCAMLRQLSLFLRCSIVLCTATQPAFDHDDLGELGLKDAQEIVPAAGDIFARLRRVRVEWPERDEALDWSALAQRMRAQHSALCIVNTRRAARELFAELIKEKKEGVFQLSTSMCPAHRLTVLDNVKKRLDQRQPCYLVSTQLIEAGVDIDFPVVLRELAPLEAIIQAAGRCNREGKRNLADGSPGGLVIAFRSAAFIAEPARYFPPDRWYRAGRDVLETYFLHAGREPKIDDPADISEYFRRLYPSGDLDQRNVQQHRQNGDFQSAADAYWLIKEDGEPVVVASWAEKQLQIQELLDDALRMPSRAAYRRLARFQVNLRRHELAKLGAAVCEEVPGMKVWRGLYDNDTGLTEGNMDALLCV